MFVWVCTKVEVPVRMVLSQCIVLDILQLSFLFHVCKPSSWILSYICIALIVVVVVYPKQYNNIAFWSFSKCHKWAWQHGPYVIFDLKYCKYSCLRVKVSVPHDMLDTILSKLILESICSVSDVIWDLQGSFCSCVMTNIFGFALYCRSSFSIFLTQMYLSYILWWWMDSSFIYFEIAYHFMSIEL